jgi:hypothetical protein
LSWDSLILQLKFHYPHLILCCFKHDIYNRPTTSLDILRLNQKRHWHSIHSTWI